MSAKVARLDLVEAMLEAALSAQRNGVFEELLRQRPLAARWLGRRFASVIRGTAGDALEGDSAGPAMFRVLLRWLVTQLRPDLEPSMDHIEREAWLNLTSWRPMLAVMCHAGLAPVPEFRERYRRRPGEVPVDNLCGLWNVGPSTFYRYLDRGKRLMATIVQEPVQTPARRLSLRRMVQADALARLQLDTPDQRQQWHRRQAERALTHHDVESSLWHSLQAGDAGAFIDTLRLRAPEVAGSSEVDALVERLSATALHVRLSFDLWMARAVLFRTRNETERELYAYQQALQIANQAKHPLLMGMVCGALGKFHESRDADRAFAYYEDSAEFLQRATPDLNDKTALDHYVTTLVRLAWLYVIRSDPRSKAVLDRAEVLRNGQSIPDDVLGMLEQTWGEYWRRAGDLARALEYKHRALNIFERIADQRSILATYLNLSMIYGETRDFERAIEYGQRVIAVAATRVVEPEILASARVNLGVAYFWQGRYDQAIEQYKTALEKSLQANLRMRSNLAHYNLAESYYKRFSISRDPEDERLGDTHTETVLSAPPSESTPALLQAARNLKAEILGTLASASTDRLLPEESAVHFDQMSDVQRHRAVLAVPMSPEAHVRARLAIANAYLAISVKEREAAQQLIARHGLGDQFAPEIGQLRQTFDRNLSREQRLLAHWKEHAGDLLDDPRRAKLIEHLVRDGSINKSGYGALCEFSAATASKHLVALAERGLLVQIGKGPSTRYQLPQ